jgi:hypothetical protein
MTSPWTAPARRPAGVTFIGVLTFLIAFASMVRGFLAILGNTSSMNPTDLTGSAGTAYGWVELGLGILIALVGAGLLRGSGLARLLVSALMVVRIIAAIWVVLTFSGAAAILASVLIGGIAVIVLLLLWNGRADAFFIRT